ncbi:hypothetical protein D3C87_1918270 [compost metagenome]
MLQQRQFQQGWEISHQLGSDNQDQNRYQHCTEGYRFNAFDTLNGRGGIPQRNVLQEAKRRVDF